MRCLLICEKKKQEEKGKEVRKTEGKKKVEELVPKRFWKWKRVFGKAESERMPVQKVWDHAIELKEGFMPKKEKVYSLLKEEWEEVQAFIEDQLQKEYIWPLKLPQILLVHFVAKKMASNKWYRIIDIWTSGLSKTGIHYHWSLISWIEHVVRGFLQSWTWGRGTTMSESKKGMNRR